MRLIVVLLLTFVLSLSTGIDQAHASGANAKAIQKDKKQEAPVVDQEAFVNPYIAQMHKSALALSEKMDETQIDNLATLRHIYGMVQSVKIARSHLEDAVNLCVKDNGEMKTLMYGRYKLWLEKVNPALEKATTRIEEEIDMDARFDDPKGVKKYFGIVDKAATYADERLRRKPLTTFKACRSLHDSMGFSMVDIRDLLEDIQWPEAPAKKASKKSEDKPKEGTAE